MCTGEEPLFRIEFQLDLNIHRDLPFSFGDIYLFHKRTCGTRRPLTLKKNPARRGPEIPIPGTGPTGPPSALSRPAIFECRFPNTDFQNDLSTTNS